MHPPFPCSFRIGSSCQKAFPNFDKKRLFLLNKLFNSPLSFSRSLFLSVFLSQKSISLGNTTSCFASPISFSMTMAFVKMVMALAVILASLGGKWAGAQVHHVVGGDRGWDPSTDVASWSSGRSFRVGDKIWFAYSAAQESIAELKSKDEYESCDVSNPIRMYTDGLDGIPLHGEGIRYFVSSRPESCKNGLKLHVDVMPLERPQNENPKVAVSKNSVSTMAAAPTTPSGSLQLYISPLLVLIGLWLCYMAI